jgi:hypothetical protein
MELMVVASTSPVGRGPILTVLFFGMGGLYGRGGGPGLWTLAVGRGVVEKAYDC